MTNRSSTHSANELFPTRPWKESFGEILGAGAFLAVAAYCFLAVPGGEGSLKQVWVTAPIAGEQVLQHIGWGFGVYIPVLLAFYAIVIGGQLVVSPTAAATRRRLGAVAQIMGASLIPALLLLLAACIHDPSQAGALVVIVPAANIMLFLAVQLGGFVVSEDAVRFAAATRTRIWAQGRLQSLRARGRRPLWLVEVLNATIGGTIALAIAICLSVPKVQVWLLVFPYVMVSVGLSFVNTFGVLAFRTAQDRLSKVVAWLFPISINLVCVITVLNFFSQGVGTIGTSLVSVLAFCTLSALWPRRFMGRFLLDWTIQGAGTAYAARSLARQYVKATREILVLTRGTAPEQSLTLRQRTVAAFRVFRAGGPGHIGDSRG